MVAERMMRTVGLLAGPAVFLVVLALPGGEADVMAVAALVGWMAIWWVSEAAPLAVTSLLPLVLLPLLGVSSVRDVAPSYSNHLIFLFFGGFVLALAVERSGLHRRIALAILSRIGGSPRRLVWGFMLATAALSMWLSNTATVLMMLPIAAAVTARVGHARTATRVFLGVAYGASVGGIGTLVGTPPNLVLAGMAPTLAPNAGTLTFGGWMLFAGPLVLLLLPVVGLQLTRSLPRSGQIADGQIADGQVADGPEVDGPEVDGPEVDGPAGGGLGSAELVAERQALGPMSPAERRAAVLFALTALAWITRAGLEIGPVKLPGWSALLSTPGAVSDAVPAVAAAILACIVPSGKGPGRHLVEWDDVRHGVPWGVLLLFGGGFAIAGAVGDVGLAGILAERLRGLADLPLPVMVLAVCLFTTTATELTSNTATATLLMPVMAALAEALHQPPYLLMVPATVSASCAFMLPVATPPNAIVMGSGQVRALDLFREGIWLNLVAAVITTAVVLTLGRLVLPIG